MDLRRSIIGTSIALLSTCSIVRAQSSGVFIEGHRVGPVGPATRQNNLPCISTGGVAYNESTNLKMIVDIPDKETFIWGTCEEYPGECQCDWKVPYDSWYCWAHGLTEHLEARFEKNHIHENPSKHEARFQLTIS